MAFFYILPVILLVGFIASFLPAIKGTIQSNYSHFSIPPGVNHPGRLQIILALVIGTSAMAHSATAALLTQAQRLTGDRHGSIFSCTSFLGKLLEKIGLCSEIAFTRYVFSGRKPGPDPQPWLSDARLGRVPVRAYRPRAPPAGPRAGVTFFHGGGWPCGSIGRAGRAALLEAVGDNSTPTWRKVRHLAEHRPHLRPAERSRGPEGRRRVGVGERAAGREEEAPAFLWLWPVERERAHSEPPAFAGSHGNICSYIATESNSVAVLTGESRWYNPVEVFLLLFP